MCFRETLLSSILNSPVAQSDASGQFPQKRASNLSSGFRQSFRASTFFQDEAMFSGLALSISDSPYQVLEDQLTAKVGIVTFQSPHGQD